MLPGWPANVGDLVITSSPAVGDIDGDGLPEIVVRATNFDSKEDALFVFSKNGQPKAPWPINPQTNYPRSTFYPEDIPPVLADLDADGDLEILLAGDKVNGTANAGVQVFQADGSLWRTFQPPGAVKIHTSPAIGDIDKDGQLDLAIVTGNDNNFSQNRLSVWRADCAQITPAPVNVPAGAIMSTALADLDGDGDLEIVILSVYGQIRVYHHDGTLVNGWAGASVPAGALSYNLSIGDMTPEDGSDIPQVVVSYFKRDMDNIERYRLTVFQANGAIVPEWRDKTIDEFASKQQPTIFDADNDGAQEILIGPYFLSGRQPPFFKVRAFNHDATPVADDRFPIYLAGDLPRAPVIADLDGDGDLEYSVASNKNSGPVEVFDLDAKDDAGAVAWGMEFHDPIRSGDYHGGVRLLEPTTTRPTNVGPFNDAADRQTLLVRLRKELPNGRITQNAVSVKIGNAPATVLGLAVVEGEYWLVIGASDQAAAGFYSLEIVWNDGGIRRVARQKNAVQYAVPVPPTDQVIVMDKSGSMLAADKYLASRTAANFYVNSRKKDDKAGVVSFHTQSTDEAPGALVLGPDGSNNRNTLSQKINAVTPPAPSARTSIGEGLRRALTNVIPAKQPDRLRAMVLLSDGLENTAPFWDKGANPVRPLFDQPQNTDIVIHTIALGPDADRDLHAKIAQATGGTSRFVYLGNSLSIFGRLADAFKQVSEDIQKEQRIFTQGEIVDIHTTRTYSVSVPPGSTLASFAISYKDPGSQTKLQVKTPAGEIYEQSQGGVTLVTGPSSKVLTIPSPAAGAYQISVTPLKAPTEVLSVASIKIQKNLMATLSRVIPAGKDEMEGTILAGLIGHGVDTDVTVMAQVVAPDKSVRFISLKDDGRSRDGMAGDGIFAAPVRLSKGGGYSITVGSLRRDRDTEQLYRTIGYFQARAKDNDLDGILDEWERGHFAMAAIEDVNPLSDPDADGLNNLEEFLYRTDPVNYDSDRDGRPDGSEVDEGSDPLEVNPTRATSADRDGDGIADEWEEKNFTGQTAVGVDAGADNDGDGLSNYTEYNRGTNPALYDSNGNGISDGVEMSWEFPTPAARGWQSAPIEESVSRSPRPVRIILIVLLIMLIAFLVLYRPLKRRP